MQKQPLTPLRRYVALCEKHEFELAIYQLATQEMMAEVRNLRTNAITEIGPVPESDDAIEKIKNKAFQDIEHWCGRIFTVSADIANALERRMP